jgi:putative ABC transport system ATP-binding protein
VEIMSGADTAALVELVDVHKAYGSGGTPSVALAGVSLRILRAAFVSLIGPSGSGKTTLLNVISGLDVPDRGRVIIDDQDLGQLKDRHRSQLRLRAIGFVFQGFNLIPSLTVGENVAWPLEFSGLTRSEVQLRTATVLDRVGVAGLARRYPAELSGGEQQRVAIARAIATRPRLILADEPTGNLDSRTGRLILDLLRELNQEDGVTIVMVTHNTFAASYGDRTLELRDGRIVRDVASLPHAASAREG